MSPASLLSIHAIVAWSTVVLLVVAAVFGARRRLLSIVATATTTVTFALGAWLYPTFTRDVRPVIYAASRAHGLAFERKEHLAVAVIALAWAGCIAVFGERKRVATIAFASAATLALGVAVLGTIVTRFRSF